MSGVDIRYLYLNLNKVGLEFPTMTIEVSSLRAFSGDGGSSSTSGVYLVRYVFLLSKKSGWSCLYSLRRPFPLWVASSSLESGASMMLETTDSMCLNEVMAVSRILLVRSTIQVQVDEFNGPTVAASKFWEASLEVFSSGIESASSLKLGVFTSQWRFSVGWRLRLQATTTAGESLQEPWCNFLFLQGCLYKACDVMFNQYM
ncbi:hypothetical protein BS78_03G032800 [Paspalum vaginatum]|nr:hypothetical protein BS78_03G032800 [Paspalum vaginatum]